MYNIKALEEEWKRFDRKRKRPWYVFFLVFFILLAIVGWFGFSDMRLDIDLLRDKYEANTTTVEQGKIYLDEPLSVLEAKNNEQIVDAPMEVPEVTDSGLKKSPATKSKVRKKLHIEVIETRNNSQSFKEVAKRFRLGHDTDDSLFLAKSYYKRKNYKKAEYWALQTNKVNENIEESWLIFAKSKVKQGQRNEAIRILNSYIKRSHSIEAKVLLEKIKAGKRI